MPKPKVQKSLLQGARVYLSGPMDFVASRTAEKKSGWRNRVSQFLQEMGVTVFDPWFKPEVYGLHEYGREGEKTTTDRDKWTFDPSPAGSATRGDLAAIRREFEARGVGPLMLAEVRTIAYRLVPRYNAVYTGVGNWRDGFDDLVQDVVCDSLLRDQQAQYLVATSAAIEDFRRLLVRQTRRCLARRRVRTIIDNLLDRARPILTRRRLCAARDTNTRRSP